MKAKTLQALKLCPLFGDITDDELREMIECFSPRVLSYKRGEVLFVEGDAQDSIGVVLGGRMSLNRENVLGNKMVLAMLEPGDLFGEMAAFSGRRHWPATVVAVEPSEVMFIAIERFSVTCASNCLHHGQLIRNMLGIISKKALLLNRKVEYLTIKGMREKLCRYILEQAQDKGSTIFDMDMNRNELADFLNVSRPSMSRELGRMRDEGLIEFYRNSIRILNPEELRQMCTELH